MQRESFIIMTFTNYQAFFINDYTSGVSWIRCNCQYMESMFDQGRAYLIIEFKLKD